MDTRDAQSDLNGDGVGLKLKREGTGQDSSGLAVNRIGPAGQKIFGEADDRGPVKIGHVAALMVARMKGVK